MSIGFEEKYFCAVNSGKGFVGFYPRITANAERVFIIKGGPGTGKSHFMREVAKVAEKNGKSVVYYYCSSDPDSLDAIEIDKKTFLLDGTAPHAVDMTLPGVRDDIINLGSFWSSTLLAEQSKSIKQLCDLKAACFERAYSCLSAAGSAVEASDTLIRPAVLDKKLSGAAKRALRALPDGDTYTEATVAINSYGMKGRVKFDTLTRLAKERISVSDDFGTAHLFFDRLLDEARRKRLGVTLSRDPLIPERIDALRIDSVNRVYEIGSDGAPHINMRRFIDLGRIKAGRNELKELRFLKCSAEKTALTALRAAATYHFRLEEIYGAAMDFSAKEDYCKTFIKNLSI